MAVMCETCKCSIYLEDKADGTRDYGGCESGCACCNENLTEKIAERVAQILAITEDDRDEYDESNPIFYAEQGPNRFATMSLFFPEEDGVRITEDLDTDDVTVHYFTGDNEVEITEGALYEWAINHYRENY